MRTLLTAIALLFAGIATAASLDAIRINEVMVENTNSITDEYGERHAWIELFNGNFAPMDISSLYITNDTTGDNWKKYPVPLGDVNTKIAKRQHVVFFADGQPNKGTFHMNFTLTPGQKNIIAIYDAGGKMLDIIEVPENVLANQTYAREEDGIGEWGLRKGGNDDYITPSSANIIRDTNDRIAMFANNDEDGIAMTIMAMGIVFTALLVLCLSFYGIGKINAAVLRMKKFRALGVTESTAGSADLADHDSGEEIAAIAMAIHEHFNAHDTENPILTINKVKRAYSPWSSKIYGLREVPEVHHR